MRRLADAAGGVLDKGREPGVGTPARRSTAGAAKLLRRVRDGAVRVARNWPLQVLVLPGLVYFLVFHYLPMYGVVIAFKDFSFRKGIIGSDWVGYAQFVKFLANPAFPQLLRNTFLLSLYGLLWGFAPPIIFALFLNEPMAGLYKRFVQTVSYLPYFISTVAVVGIVFLILSPQGGIVNILLAQLLGVEPRYFLADQRWFRTIYISSGVWQSLGFSAIVYLAALSAVDQQLYESATIDGASRLRKMLSISLPSIRPTITIMLILAVGHIMSVNTEKVLLMQLPMTYDVSDVIGTYVYRRGLVYFEYSYGAAVGLFNSLINVAFLVVSNTLARRFADYSLW
jgi:putative aldouronate transport system permease protein